MINESIGKYLVYNGQLEKSQDSSRFDNFSDMCSYEVMGLEDAIVLFLEDHLTRIKKSNGNIDLDQVQEDLKQLIDKNDLDTGFIKILIQDGNILMYEHWDMDLGPDEDLKVSIFDYTREDPNQKRLNLDYKSELNRILMDDSSFEAILRNDKGQFTEGGRSNLYFVKADTVFKAPKDLVLPGIRSQKIEQILDAEGIKSDYRLVHDYELLDMDGAFLTGTTVGLRPIDYVESIRLNSSDNDLIKNIINKYEDLKESYKNNKK